MKQRYLLAIAICFFLTRASAQSPTVLYSEDFSENVGTLPNRHISYTSGAERTVWAVSGKPQFAPNNTSGLIAWLKATKTCSWVSAPIDVAGYTSLNLSLTMSEEVYFNDSDSINVYVYEDGVERLLRSDVGNDFSSFTISEACTASVSLQVKVLLMINGGYTDYVRLEDVEVTGVYAFDDIDADGVDDASDGCIDLDGDGTCDDSDASIMLMDEDFSSYAAGTGLSSGNEAGIAYIQGYSGAGDAGWTLLGEAQLTGVAVASSGGKSYLKYTNTGGNAADTTSRVTLLSRCLNVAHVTDPKVRFVASEVTPDFTEANSNGRFIVSFIEDGTERQVFSAGGEFTAVDTTIATTAKSDLTVVIVGYAQFESELHLERLSVFGDYCQTGKDGNGDCQDIGCTDNTACTYNALAITNDATKCKHLGDACNDGNANNYLDRYVNAGNGTCSCQGYALQTVYKEDFSAYGAAQGGLGYGYEGSYDVGPGDQNVDNSSGETEWSLSFEGTGVGGGTSLVPSPFYFATQVVSGDTVMKALNTNGDHMRWTTRNIDVSSFDSLYISAQLIGLGNQGASDYMHLDWVDGATVQSPVLEEITGVNSTSIDVMEKITPASSTIQVRVEIENNVSGSNAVAAHAFDEVEVLGLKQGCTDPDASNYDAAPSDGHVARSDDGSCQYDWATVYSRLDGEFDDVIWAGKACSEAGYTCGSASQYIDIKSVTESGSRHAVISANTQVTVPTGGYSLGQLTLESGAVLVVNTGTTLTINGNFNHQGGTISGTGRIVVKGELGLAAGVTSVEVHDFTFGAGGQLNLLDGDKLVVKGDLTIDDGSSISGRIEMTGTSAQTISGLDVHFDTLRIANSAASPAVTFAASAQIDGVLDIDQGVVDMNGHVLTFGSDANGTGMLDMIASGASLEDGGGAASAIVKRYIAPDGDGTTIWGYTQFGSPLNGATIGDFGNATDFYYSGVAGSDYPNSSSTVLLWDEKSAQLISPSTANTPMDTLGGTWIALLGSQNPTLHSSGTLRNHAFGGYVTMNLTRTPSSDYDGWNMIFNPFQSILVWDEVADYHNNSSVIEDQYAVWDSQDRGYNRYSESNGLLTSASGLIMPGQAFWVRMNHATDTVGSIRIPTAAMSLVDQGTAFTRNEIEGSEDAVLVLEIENGFGADVALVRIGSGGSLEYLGGQDLSFMGSSSIKKGQLAIMANDWPCVSKYLPNEAEVDLFVKSRANVATTMRVVDFTAGAEICVTITDTETGAVLTSLVGDEMTFTLPQHEAASGRFVLSVKPSAVVSPRPPSCPELTDGRVEVMVGEEPANVLLTDGGDNVLDHIVGATGTAVFEDLMPGDYGLVVAGPGLQCGTQHREFSILPGEQPELLGMDWEVPACNEGDIALQFELYGHGDFNASLRLGNEEVWSNVETGGEVSLAGLTPGTYALEVDHVCLQETVVLDLFDANTVMAAADYDAMVIMDPIGGTALEAISSCVGEEQYRWVVDGEVVGENEPLFHPVDNVGGHVVKLEAWNAVCSDIVELPFLVINWNEARVLDAPITVREDATHWTLVFGRDLGWTDLRLMDAAGRLVWTGQVQGEEGYIFRLERPATAGTYLMQVSGDGGQWGLPLLNAGF